MASQFSTALVLTITITMPGRGFKAGGSVKSREVLLWEELQNPQQQNPEAVCVPCTVSQMCFLAVPAALRAVQV